MAVTYFKKKEDDDEDEEKKNSDEEEDDDNKRKKSKFLGLVPAIASVITFFVTEDLAGKMQLTDKWTIAMVAMLAVNGVAAYLTRNKDNDNKDDSETAEA